MPTLQRAMPVRSPFETYSFAVDLDTANENQNRDFNTESKEMRENLTEAQIDKIIEDSFPASDPPAWY